MIFKYFESKKINLEKHKLILFHGKNEGYKNELTNYLTKKRENLLFFDEKEILENPVKFIEILSNKSLFDNEKFIIIKRLQIE